MGEETHKAAAWERKTLTVLLTDICGSTRLSRRIELEPYGDLFLQVESVWRGAAELHGGLVSRIQGDGCMILFGHERPSERDVVDAVDAALHIHRQLADLRIPSAPGLGGLRARSGIHTGVALVRPGDAARGLHNVMGEAPNVAGTLEKHAGPGDVLVSIGSLKPHEGFFTLEPRRVPAAEEDLQGEGVTPDDAAVVHVAGRRASMLRYDATTQRGLTPLIGREDVIAGLLAFLGARGEERQRVAVLTAAAGLGKTRLLRELDTTPEMARYHVMRGSCESYRETEVLQPFVQMLRAELEAGDAARDRERIEAAIAGQSVEELIEVIAGIAVDTRVLLVIDDWQWADDASRRLLQGLLDRPAAPRVILAGRPGPEGIEWMRAALQLRLQPWTEAQTAHAVRRWLSDADPLLVGKLHEYAGGVPLLVEELCHSNSSFRLWQTLEGRGTPRDAGLRLLVASRLAQLAEPLSTVVQAAAVIGTQVPRWLLDEVCGVALTDAQLRALADADFLYPETSLDVLRFKHGLTRDAVYGHVALAQRQAMHQRARQALERRVADRQEALAALAYHCDGSGDAEAASHFAERAGLEALKAHSMDLARSHYRRALDALDRLEAPSPEQKARWCTLSCRLAMASVFDPLSLGNDTGVLDRAVRIAQESGDAGRRAECLYWLGYLLYSLGRFREGVLKAREALTLSRALGHDALASQVEATLGEILVGTGDYDEALHHIDAAVQAKRQRAGSRRGGPPIGSAYALACKGSVLADRGQFAPAQACFDEAIELLGRSTHPVGNSVRNWIVVAYLWQGRWQEARTVATDSMRIAENTGALYLLAVSRSTLGFAQWCESGDAQGLRLMSDSVRWMAARRGRMFTSLHFGWLAEAHVTEGRLSEARPLIAHALRRARQGERLGESIVARTMARAEAMQGRPDRARAWLQRAERSALARGSAREQALNALTQAQLLRWQGDVQDAATAARAATATIDALTMALPAPLLRTLG